MEMRVSNSVIIVLFFALLCGTHCSEVMQLCSNSLTGFKNGTEIPATVGKPVTISFCVQWQNPDRPIDPYIKIIHPKCLKQSKNYYHLDSENTTKLWVKIVYKYQNTATINITIIKVENADLRSVFVVELNTVNKSFRSDVSVFTFQLMLADPSSTTSSSTDQSMSSPGYANTPSTDGLPDVRSTPPTNTPAGPECNSVHTPPCPKNSYQVDNDTCLLVTDASYHSQLRAECSIHGAKPLQYSGTNKFNSCLTKILDDSQGEYKQIIRLTYGYVGIKSYILHSWQYKLACFQHIHNFKSPAVSLFSLEFHNKKWELADNSTLNVTVNTTYNDFKLTCLAEGIPTPTVLITDESQKEIKSGELLSLANCNQPGMYTCTAKNHLGSSLSRKTIQIVNPTRVTEFTAARKPWRMKIRRGDDVALKCLVDGCPKQVTITRGADLIDDAASFTNSFVHEIKSVNCSHMGTYTCLAKFQSGPDVEETAELGVNDCPVSLCQIEATPHELFPVLKENVTFTLCLMSTETIHLYAGNTSKMFVTFTRTSGKSFYWTANITIYGIQASDYRTHRVRIKNSIGGLDYTFRLKYADPSYRAGGQASLEHESELNALHIALPPIGFIIIVVIIVAIVWCRVKGTWKSRSRADEMSVCGNDNDDNGEVLYANMKETSAGRVTEVTEVHHDEETDKIQYHCQETDTQCHVQETDRLQYRQNGDTAVITDTDPGRVTSADGLVYITVVNAKKQVSMKSKRGKQTQKPDDEDDGPVVYLTLDFEKTGKIKLIEDKETKAEETAEQDETQ